MDDELSPADSSVLLKQQQSPAAVELQHDDEAEIKNKIMGGHEAGTGDETLMSAATAMTMGTGGVFMKDINVTRSTWLEEEEEEKRIIEMLKEWVKDMIGSMEEGEISASPYDAAWLGMVKHKHKEQEVGSELEARYGGCLDWIVENQLEDGSWGGDKVLFSARDRMICTLACVVALKTWNLCPKQTEKGIEYMNSNMWKLEEENVEHTPIAFEVTFPSLLHIAQQMGIQLPYNSPVLKRIYYQKQLKIKRIPPEVLYNVPTTLIHSLEGIPNLDWNKLIKLQNKDGSFLCSPASTAFAYMETGEENCLKYLNRVYHKFNGAVPNVYPVDLFERLWVVDRLQRLGISRHFNYEIKLCLDYVYKYWRDDGICWSSTGSPIVDLDDTSMGFRLLRLHKYGVCPDVFKDFKKNGEFFCFSGQLSQAVTGIYNLYRASMLIFPGESILEDAVNFSEEFLRDKQATNQLLDKWIITKDLTGEVEYARDFHFYASLPRIEARTYIEQYGVNDVWIGKTLYRMPHINNEKFLELATLEFNQIQRLHQMEWEILLNEYDEHNNIGDDDSEDEIGWLMHINSNNNNNKMITKRRTLLEFYFLAASIIFQPERAPERLAWARTMIMAQTISIYFCGLNNDHFIISSFVEQFSRCRYQPSDECNIVNRLINLLVKTINLVSLETSIAHGHLISSQLKLTWVKWMMSWLSNSTTTRVEGNKIHPVPSHLFGAHPIIPTCMAQPPYIIYCWMGAHYSNYAQLLVDTINLCGGRSTSSCNSTTDYDEHVSLLNTICSGCCRIRENNLKTVATKVSDMKDSVSFKKIDFEMSKLVKYVLTTRPRDGEAGDEQDMIRETLLDVAKCFYYKACCPPSIMHKHIAKVLFERVA